MRARALRRRIVQGQTCVYCGAPAEEADHRIPTSRGGREERGNLQPACRRCNRSKGNRGAPKPVFSGGSIHIPVYGRLSLPTRRYSLIRGDFSRRTPNASGG